MVDSGTGIHPELLPHVFERFLQGEAGASRQHGGLGLGLAIAKQLVELHGGEITAHSAGQGQGATFRVRLPLKSEPIGAENERRSDITGQLNLNGLRILLVEDESSSRQGTARLLEAHGATAQREKPRTSANALLLG